MLDNTLQRWVPAHLLEAGDDAQIQEACRTNEEVCVAVLRYFNGDWSLSIPEHYCSGVGCCDCLEDTSRKMTGSILAIMQCCVTGGLLPRETNGLRSLLLLRLGLSARCVTAYFRGFSLQAAMPSQSLARTWTSERVTTSPRKGRSLQSQLPWCLHMLIRQTSC